MASQRWSHIEKTVMVTEIEKVGGAQEQQTA